MGLTRKTSIAVFILTIFFLFISIAFKNNITAYAVFSAEVLDFPAYNYLIIILLGATVASGYSMRAVIKNEKEIEQELRKFKVDQPNRLVNNLKEYICYCLYEGRSETKIRDILKKTGWNEASIEEAFENPGEKRQTSVFQ